MAKRQHTISISHLTPEVPSHYVIKVLARIWERQGHRVEIGSDFSTEADLCILHHDRTRINPASLPAYPGGVRVVNSSVLDISKRLYSTLRLEPGADWPGSVIVKTNLNHFGAPEAGRDRRLLKRARRRLARYSWPLARVLPPRCYPILKSIKDVPDWVWAEDELIVERFMPERDGDFYCLRGWFFLGDKGYGYKLYATEPLVKSSCTVKRDYIDEAPEEIERYRHELGFDYGKFDYVEHNGMPTLLDANKTPTYSGKGESPRLRRIAEGIRAYFQ